jgi:hypothetical protein
MIGAQIAEFKRSAIGNRLARLLDPGYRDFKRPELPGRSPTRCLHAAGKRLLDLEPFGDEPRSHRRDSR